MTQVKAFAPANISCIFVIKKGKNSATTGSLGLGFTVNKGVFATIKKLYNDEKTNKIYYNNKKINFPTVDSVIKKLTDEKVIVYIKSKLPLGCGFGISGASALATAYALDKLLNLKTRKNQRFSRKSKKELAMIAHIAEVENNTGLGDVVNQYYGGFLVKYESSYKFEVNKIPIKNKKIYYKYFSSINTRNIISNGKNKNIINKAGIKALNKIKKSKNPNLKNLIKISKEFSVNSGLLKSLKNSKNFSGHKKSQKDFSVNNNVINIIKKIENKKGNASMIMLGNAVFSDVYFKDSKELIIKDKGACLL